MTTTFTIHRDALNMDPLIVHGSRAAALDGSGMWFPEGGIAWPQFTPRYTYAPDSAYAAGRRLLAVVLDQGSLPASIKVTGSTLAELVARRAVLEQAVSQLLFQVDLSIDGAVGSWESDFTWPLWASPTPESRTDLRELATLTFPLNP